MGTTTLYPRQTKYLFADLYLVVQRRLKTKLKFEGTGRLGYRWDAMAARLHGKPMSLFANLISFTWAFGRGWLRQWWSLFCSWKPKQLMLPARSWGSALYNSVYAPVYGMRWKWFHRWQTKCLFASRNVYKRRERRGNVALFHSWKQSQLMLPASSLEALIATRYMQMECDGSTLPNCTTKYLFPSLSVYKGSRTTR